MASIFDTLPALKQKTLLSLPDEYLQEFCWKLKADFLRIDEITLTDFLISTF